MGKEEYIEKDTSLYDVSRVNFYVYLWYIILYIFDNHLYECIFLNLKQFL